MEPPVAQLERSQCFQDGKSRCRPEQSPLSDDPAGGAKTRQGPDSDKDSEARDDASRDTTRDTANR
eukprot:3642304-Rhodomonas_salina.7